MDSAPSLWLEWDWAIFQLINGWHGPLGDRFMYLVSETWPWIPLYLILLWGVYHRWGWKGLLWVVLMLAMLVSLTDRISAGFFKPFFERLRPCHAADQLPFPVHVLPGDCGGRYGFVSSHASNFFGLATFFSLAFKHRGWTLGLFLIATLVSYSRIYLGVHYPSDILGGALLGMICGWVMAFTFNQVQARWPKHFQK